MMQSTVDRNTSELLSLHSLQRSHQPPQTFLTCPQTNWPRNPAPGWESEVPPVQGPRRRYRIIRLFVSGFWLVKDWGKKGNTASSSPRPLFPAFLVYRCRMTTSYLHESRSDALLFHAWERTGRAMGADESTTLIKWRGAASATLCLRWGAE